MPKIKTIFICSQCGYEAGKWLGRCPTCGMYNTLEESTVDVQAAKAQTANRQVTGGGIPVLLKEVSLETDLPEGRAKTGLPELDRVLNGGIVGGSLILLGGEPGIGKSTLLMQLCGEMGRTGYRVLYVTGEESAGQVKMRASRLNINDEGVYLLAETDMDAIRDAVLKIKPALLMVDSIQTMRRGELTSLPGSVVQVRECAALFTHMAKSEAAGMAVILVGHVTKEGNIAGPRILEHMVDTVLYFEGERHGNYRIIRAYKNRFGATDEIGIFEMRGEGLRGIDDPSAHMLAGRPVNVPGTTVTCSMEGTRPMLMEVQALVSYTNFGTPRRTANGMDYNRVVMLIAVLEKRAGYKLSTYDSYVNVAGGMRIDEPAADAGAVAALASCYKGKPIDPLFAVIGEVGLAGELRAVYMAEKRVAEARRHGFTGCVLPQANLGKIQIPEGIRVFGAAHVGELLNLVL